MNTVVALHKKQEELKRAMWELYDAECEAIRRSLLTCAKCGKSSKLNAWTFIQRKWWVPASGCTEGAYWKNSELQLCYVVCPKCGYANYIYNHPQRKKIFYFFGVKLPFRPLEKFFKEVIVKTSR